MTTTHPTLPFTSIDDMLGALDEYFTVNGVDWGPGRQATGAIMNNPANPPVAREATHE